jgi:hypothetical protein
MIRQRSAMASGCQAAGRRTFPLPRHSRQTDVPGEGHPEHIPAIAARHGLCVWPLRIPATRYQSLALAATTPAGLSAIVDSPPEVSLTPEAKREMLAENAPVRRRTDDRRSNEP